MSDPSIDRMVEIEGAAALDDVNYDLAAPELAKRLGIRRSTLDSERKKKRRELRLENGNGDDGKGRPLELPDILPWPDPMEGDHVASALGATFKRYIRMSDAQADLCALWVLLTWTLDKFSIAPRLCVTSPTKGCGKTTLLSLIGRLSRKALMSGSVSPAALFRAIEQLRPTFLLDENEKYLEPGSDFHAILNQGHRRGQHVIRTHGDDHELRMFDTFCLVAVARNGRTPDDLEQRSFVIELQRRLPGESLVVLKDDCEDLDNLRRMCARWADDYAGDISDVDPDMGGLINRVADNWRPLFTIAEVIVSDWPDRMRDACAALMPKGDDSNDTILLADIRAIFDEKGADRLSSEQICDALISMEGRPWAEYGKGGKPISKNQLAYRLAKFGVRPENVRIGDHVPKGYYRRQFDEVWGRYLTLDSEHPPYETLQRYKPMAIGTSTAFQGATEKPDVAVQKCEKPPSNGPCSDVAAQNPYREDSMGLCTHCGAGGELLETYYSGPVPVWLHRDCQERWRAAQDELYIPLILKRRPPAISSGPDDDLNDFKH
jgi:hypothetical protein